MKVQSPGVAKKGLTSPINVQRKESSPVQIKHASVSRADTEQARTLKKETFARVAGEEKKSRVELGKESFGIAAESQEGMELAKELLSELREEMHREMNNMHVEIIRQFQIQLVTFSLIA